MAEKIFIITWIRIGFYKNKTPVVPSLPKGGLGTIKEKSYDFSRQKNKIVLYSFRRPSLQA